MGKVQRKLESITELRNPKKEPTPPRILGSEVKTLLTRQLGRISVGT